MNKIVRRLQITPTEYEQEVAKILHASENNLSDLKVTHKEIIPGPDGEFEIDVTARFTALGANFLVLVECKYHKHPIKRDVVQILHDKLQSLGAQKGMIFSTSGFQSGAIEYARVHGIALVVFQDGSTSYIMNSLEPPKPPPWVPKAVGWLIGQGEEGRETYSLLSYRLSDSLDNFLSSK